ncbi:MAG: hypothetical protein KDB16_13595 [Acidimicrobiales bacterium]|nr:hypothetical protein [Acidimicrobiales bacterium]
MLYKTAVAMALLATLGSCSVSIGGSQTPAEIAEATIDEKWSDEIGASLEATCDDPGEIAVGETFDCSATDDAGEDFRFYAVRAEDGVIEVYPLNFVTPETAETLQEAAGSAVVRDLAISASESPVDCSIDATVMLPPSNEFVCAVTDPATGDVIDVVLTLDFRADNFEPSYRPDPRQAELAASPVEAAIALIEGDWAELLGARLAAECPGIDPSQRIEPGSVIDCTGTTDTGEVVRFDVNVAADDVTADPRNIIAGAVIEEALAGLRDGDTADDFACAESVIVPDQGNVECTYTDPATADEFAVVVAIDLATGNFSADIANQPNP